MTKRPILALTTATATAVAVAVASFLAGAGPAGAHTETDVVAVPAGGEATVKLEPTHGCDGSPTVAVSIRAPMEGATAGDVAGWTATANPDGDGNTILEWTGGSLPADQAGEFPVTFSVPDEVGTLLTFPAVQRCENGDVLQWTSGNPADDYPAPRLLILASGSEPAATIDDVPADAPGRDLLVEIVDVDGPEDATTTTTENTGPTTTADTPASSSPPTTTDTDATSDDDDSSSTGLIFGGLLIAVLAVAGGVALRRSRSQSADY